MSLSGKTQIAHREVRIGGPTSLGCFSLVGKGLASSARRRAPMRPLARSYLLPVLQNSRRTSTTMKAAAFWTELPHWRPIAPEPDGAVRRVRADLRGPERTGKGWGGRRGSPKERHRSEAHNVIRPSSPRTCTPQTSSAETKTPCCIAEPGRQNVSMPAEILPEMVHAAQATLNARRTQKLVERRLDPPFSLCQRCERRRRSRSRTEHATQKPTN